MKTVTVPLYVIDNAKEAIRIAANILDSRKRETAADRQIEYSERLLNWVLDGQKGQPPKYLP